MLGTVKPNNNHHRWQANVFVYGGGGREEFGHVKESNWLHSIKVGCGLNKFQNFSAEIYMVDVT